MTATAMHDASKRQPAPRARGAWRFAFALALGTTAGSGTALAAQAAPPRAIALEPFRAVYEVRHEGKRRGESTLELQRTDDGWRYTLDAEATRGLARLSGFAARQVTEFRIVDGRPRLLRSLSRNTVLLREREVLATFDWSTGDARWTGDVKPERRGPVPLGKAPLNAHLLNLVMAVDIRGQAPGDLLRYRVLERGRADRAEYRVGEPEPLQVPFGTFHAIPATSIEPEKRRTTTAWYGPGLPATPLRVLQVRDGKPRFELRLLRIEQP